MLANILNHFRFTNRPSAKWARAQEGELSWWKGVAREGYEGKSREDFISNAQREWLLSQLEIVGREVDYWRDKTIIEFGSGPAGFVEYINAARKIAIEPLIGKYRAEFPHLASTKVEYVELPAEKADRLTPGIADLVICFNVLDHTYDPPAVLSNLSRAAKTGADLLFQVNVYRTEQQRQSKTGLHAEMHPHSFLLSEIVPMIEKHGFSISRQFCSEDMNPSGEYYFVCSGTKL